MTALEQFKKFTTTKKRFPVAEALTSLGLFLLALLPRAYALQRFVTADEAKWVYRSAQFLAAFLRGDFAATSVNLTPAVTTTWLGSLGLALYHWFNRASIEVPLVDWLTSLPQFRTELDLLAVTRWPMVIFTSLGVVVIYWLSRRLFHPGLALIAAALIALDPHTVALSRIIGHDAPMAVFMTISLLSFLLAVRGTEARRRHLVDKGNDGSNTIRTRSTSSLWLLILSGFTAGLAFLSKAPGLFLIPFAGLVFLVQIWRDRPAFFFWVQRLFLWGVIAYLTFIAFWPAAWVEPVGRPVAVLENAFLSATDEEEADAEGHWLVPDLGPFYYLVNGGFKLSPLVMVGAGLALIPILRHRSKQTNKPTNQPTNQLTIQLTNKLTNHPSIQPTLSWLLTFVLLFTLFLTLSDKRSPRYLLPAFPALAVVAAFGWLALYQMIGGLQTKLHPVIFPFVLIFSALVMLLPYVPYYFTYFNPLLGGPYTAQRLVKIGWGEGLDQVGRFLQQELRDSRVGTAYASTVAPFFEGDISSVTGDNLDYVVLYSKQVQSGGPSPAFIRYFEQRGALFSVKLNGIHYADLYAGPALQPALVTPATRETAAERQPIGFRSATPYGHIGQPLEVDVLWSAADPLPTTPATLTLEPITALEGYQSRSEEAAGDTVLDAGSQLTTLAAGQGMLTRLAEDLIISRHQLPLPEALPRGSYALFVEEQPLGQVELRHFQVPSAMKPMPDLIFGEQISLAGFDFALSEDYIGVTIAWQAQKPRLPDYTVFVQLLEAETNQRLAGIDTQPQDGNWPTSRWVRNEVVVDEYLVAVPPGLPSGYYKMIVGLYRPETGQRLTLPDGRDHWTLPATLIRENRHSSNG